MTAIERLSTHLARAVGDGERAMAAAQLTDWLACVAGGRGSVAVGGEGDPVLRAALWGNSLEMDDVHRAARLHPGPVVWPAALMASRDAGAGWTALLDAGVLGYEAMIALGETLDAHHYAHWHPTATAGGVGAAAAGAGVMGLDEERTADAIGHAVSLAGGLWQMRRSANATKAVHVAHAARTGVWAARLAAGGARGVRDALEGEQGLWAATCRAPGELGLEDGWRIAQVSAKPWAACRHAHPAIDAALDLRGGDGPVRVETYADALAFCDRPEPATAADARFSLQHAVAVALAEGEPRPEQFEPPAIARLAPVRARVEVAEAADLTHRYPAHFGARVTAGGRTVERLDTRGDPERPLDGVGRRAKLETLVAWGGRPAGDADRVEEAVRGGDLAGVLALLAEWTR